MDQNPLLIRIADSLDEVKKDISAIKVLDAVQNEQLMVHMKRSDLLEKRVEQVDSRIQPIEAHVHQVSGMIKLVAGIAAVAGLLLTLKELLWP